MEIMPPIVYFVTSWNVLISTRAAHHSLTKIVMLVALHSICDFIALSLQEEGEEEEGFGVTMSHFTGYHFLLPLPQDH